LAGAGVGLAQAGLLGYRDQLESAREQRLAQLQEARDQRLYEHQDELQRKTQEFQSTENKLSRDLTVSEAEKTRGLTREEGAATRLSQKEIAQMHEEAATKRHGQSMGAQAATNARLDKELGLRTQEFDLKKRIADIEFKNIEEIDKRRREYGTATPERKAEIRDEIALLNGKDKDNWIVTGVNPDPDTGRATEYIKINKTTGEEVPLNYGRGAPAKGEKKQSKADLAMQFFTGDEPEKKKPEGRARSGLIQRNLD
jgi:hypothetical protein